MSLLSPGVTCEESILFARHLSGDAEAFLSPLEELLEVEDPRWPHVKRWIDEAINTVEVCPPGDTSGEALVAPQVTTRSPMGAVIYETGGLLVDHGWLRVLGGGCARMPRSLPSWNEACGLTSEQPALLIVADDAVGGSFALNGGALGEDLGAMYYFAPDSLGWEPLDLSYSQFLHWCLSGDLNTFYADLRWSTWKDDVQALPPDSAFSFYPFLWAEAESLEARSRREIPALELFKLQLEFVNQLAASGQ